MSENEEIIVSEEVVEESTKNAGSVIGDKNLKISFQKTNLV